MEKVKKYADRRNEDLKLIFTEMAKKLQNMDHELEARITQAGAATSMLDEKRKVFDAYIQNLQADINAVQNIESKVNSFAKILHELNDMSAAVEENLKRIQNESKVVTNLENRLAEQQKIVDNIGKRIPQITSDFNTKNSEQLKIIASTLLNQYESYGTKIKDTLEADRKEAERLLAEIEGNISRAFSQAVEKADSLEETAFHHLSEKAEKRSDKYLTELKFQSDAIELKVREEVAQMEKDLLAHVNETAAQLEKATNEINDRVENHAADVEARIDTKVQDLETRLFNETDNFETKLTEKNKAALEKYEATSDKFHEDVKNHLGKVNDKLKGHVEQIEKAYTEKFTRMDADFTDRETKLKALQETLEADLAKCSSETERVKADAESAVTQAEASVARLRAECDTAISRANQVQPELEGKVNELSDKIEQFQQTAQSRMDNLNKLLNDGISKALADSETRRLQILEGVDDGIAVYKKDLEYKLSQIQTSRTDVDMLEKSLKDAMNEVQTRVLTTFDNFTQEQQTKNERFVSSLKDSSMALENQIQDIENSLDKLRDVATGSMSAKLQDFEDQFTQNLLVRDERISADLTEWKSNLDSRLETLSSEYITARREIESSYLDKLKINIGTLESKTTEQIDKVNTEIQSAKDNVQTTLDTIRQSIDDFNTATTDKINNITFATDSEIKAASEKNVQHVNEQLEKVQGEILANMRAFEESITSRQQTGSANIDAALADFNSWKSQLTKQMDESKELFNGEMETFKTSVTARIAETHDKLNNAMNEYSDSISKKQDALTESLSELQEKAKTSLQEYEERSSQITNQLQSMYENMLKETEEKVRNQHMDAATKIQELKQELQDISDKSRANQTSLVLKIQTEENEMQSQMSDLNKELGTLKAQITTFERADQLKRQLDENMSDLESSFIRLDQIRGESDNVNAIYNNIMKINDDMKKQIEVFERESGKLSDLQNRFNTLSSVSHEVDDRLAKMTSVSDDLQTYEVSLRNFTDDLKTLEGRYARLEQKNETLDRVVKDVDTAFDQMKNLEQTLRDCTRQANSLPQEIKDIQNNVDRLLQHGPKITEAVSKLEQLDESINSTEKRFNALSSVQTGLKNTEIKLSQLNAGIDKKMDILHDIAKSEVSKNGAKDGVVSPKDREKVRELARLGWKQEEIFKTTHIPMEAIDLILSTPDNF